MRMMRKITFCFIMLVVCLLICMKTNTTQASSIEKARYYTSLKIQEGDTLWAIAQKHAPSTCQSVDSYIRDIKNMNHMFDDTLMAGSHIIIYYDAISSEMSVD